MLYRYDKTAVWHKAITSSDNEQIRPGIKGVEFRCFERVLKSKSPARLIEGAPGSAVTVTLQTDNPMAKEIKGKDTVEYQGHKYKVVSVEEITSLAYRGAKEYLIGLH